MGPAPQSNGGQESARADTSVNSDAGLDNQLFKDAEDGNIVCTHCDYISKQRDRMVRHFKTVHLKEKPHVCTLCTSSFGRKDKLKRHLDTVHSTAKPFKCDYCATAFNRRDKLKAHINSLHFKSTPPPHHCLRQSNQSLLGRRRIVMTPRPAWRPLQASTTSTNMKTASITIHSRRHFS